MKLSDYSPLGGVVETLIAINVLVYFITLLMPAEMITNFGLYAPLALERPWALLTSMFLHDPNDFEHIAFNMITMLFFGMFLERLVGEREFLKVYFIGGLAGSLFFVALSQGSMVPAIGASGAIFAVGGALAVLRPNQTVLLFFFIPMPLWVAVIGGFIAMSLFLTNIAWQAHLGGLLVGLAFGYLHRRKLTKVQFGYFLE